VANIKAAVQNGAARISLFGDARLLGKEYWKKLTALLSHEEMPFVLYMELFSPATEEYMRAWRSVTSGKIIMALSPESADAKVRRALGKNYSNEEIINQVVLGFDQNIRVSLGFMFPLPEQDFTSIVRTQEFINNTCRRFNRLIGYMYEPILFIDPGSLIFDEPEKYGYRIEDRTLEGLVHALNRPHWYYSLNYSTAWMSKKGIIEAIFFIGRSRNRLTMEFLGRSERNLFHQSLIAQQERLITVLEENSHLKDEEVEGLIEATIDQTLRQMNLSITMPDVDLLNIAE